MAGLAGTGRAVSRMAILAGGGSMPQQLIDHLTAIGTPPLVLAFRGETGALNVPDRDLHWCDVGAVGTVIKYLQENEVHDVVLLGAFRRPDFKNLKLDMAGAALLPKILKAAAVGDDALLRVLVDYLEKRGFAVHGADHILSELTAEAGTLGRELPSAQDLGDIERGIEVATQLGRLDIGQAAVIRNGQVLAVEAAEGTDQMLQRVAMFTTDVPSGVLVKCAKPQQDRRVDLPTIGPATINNVGAVNLRGIAVQAGATLIAERQVTIDKANELQIFIHGFVIS